MRQRQRGCPLTLRACNVAELLFENCEADMRFKEGCVFGLGGAGNVFPEHFGRQRRIAFEVDEYTGPVVKGQADCGILFRGSFQLWMAESRSAKRDLRP